MRYQRSALPLALHALLGCHGAWFLSHQPTNLHSALVYIVLGSVYART